MVDYQDRSKSLLAKVLEVNVHKRVDMDNLLSCYLGMQTMGDEYDCPILFWENGWLICSCRRDGDMIRIEENSEASSVYDHFPSFPRRRQTCTVEKDVFCFFFPVLCACPYEKFNETIKVHRSPEVTVMLVKPGSEFIRRVFRESVEDAVKRVDGEK